MRLLWAEKGQDLEFLGSAEHKSWVSLSRVKVNIMKVRCFSFNEDNSLTNLAPNYPFSVKKKNPLQGKFKNFTPRLRASLGRENPSLGFFFPVLESVILFRITDLQSILITEVKTECSISK